jgi:serine phosphatase RsbU (regulator of sigma subunit)
MPASQIQDRVEEMFEELPSGTAADVPADHAGTLLLRIPPVAPDLSCESLLEHFSALPLSVQTLAVVADGKALGVVTRSEVVDRFSRLYFREIYGKKPLLELMNPHPLTVEEELSLDELGRLVAGVDQATRVDAFVITNHGRYAGMGTVQALLRELTDRKQALLAAALERATAKLLAAQAELLEKQRLQQELDIAHEIQTALLPRQVPVLPGYTLRSYYRPAAQVGGDYYDFLLLDGASVGLVVADVAGKGVPGSLGMAMARSVLRSQASGRLSPLDTLRRTNATLLPDLRSGMFITMAYGVLDLARHELRYASAGHNPALHWRPGRGPQWLAPQGMALGLAGGAQYLVEEQAQPMEPGDLVLLYTDGVTEALEPGGEEYGERRLAESLARHGAHGTDAALDGVLADLAGFVRGAAQADDITLVLLQRAAA